MFTLIMWVVFGYISGSIAMWLLPPREPIAGWHTIAVGVAGSILSGMAMAVTGGDPYAPAGLLGSIVGGVAVVAAWRWYSEAP